MKREKQAVYRHELGVLSRSKLELKRPETSTEGLRAEYERLTLEYEKLLKWSQKIASISDAQAKMLRRRENDMKSLLDHANQGFLTVGSNLRVNPQYSKACHRIFGRSIFGANIVDLVFGQAHAEREVLSDLLRQALSGTLSLLEAQTLLLSLPNRAVIGETSVILEYRPIIDEWTEERLMLLLSLIHI